MEKYLIGFLLGLYIARLWREAKRKSHLRYFETINPQEIFRVSEFKFYDRSKQHELDQINEVIQRQEITKNKLTEKQ